MTKPMDAFMSDLLTTHRDDPANTRYVVPLENPEDEEMAHDMADAVYEAYGTDHFTDDTSRK